MEKARIARPMQPGNADYLEARRRQVQLRATHAALLQAIAERGLSAQEVAFLRLKRLWRRIRWGQRLPDDLDARRGLPDLGALAATLNDTSPRGPRVR